MAHEHREMIAALKGISKSIDDLTREIKGLNKPKVSWRNVPTVHAGLFVEGKMNTLCQTPATYLTVTNDPIMVTCSACKNQ